MKVTASQIKRVTDDYTKICQEPVKVEFVDNDLDSMFVYGSELAMYRLHYKMTVGRVNFSTNLNTWYYTKN